MGKTCKSDVKVLLHARTPKRRFFPSETQFFAHGNVKVLLQRKKFHVCNAGCKNLQEQVCSSRSYRNTTGKKWLPSDHTFAAVQGYVALV